jgi:hypothetical protein
MPLSNFVFGLPPLVPDKQRESPTRMAATAHCADGAAIPWHGLADTVVVQTGSALPIG